MEIKPGYKTTEFLVTIIQVGSAALIALLSILSILGYVSKEEEIQISSIIARASLGITAMILGSVTTRNYEAGRREQKLLQQKYQNYVAGALEPVEE